MKKITLFRLSPLNAQWPHLTTRWTVVLLLPKPAYNVPLTQVRMVWSSSRQWKCELQFSCLSRGTFVIITKHPQLHSPVVRSSLVRDSTVVAPSITELNTVDTQGPLWQQSVPEMKTVNGWIKGESRCLCVCGVGVILPVILSYRESIFSPCNCSMRFFLDFTR